MDTKTKTIGIAGASCTYSVYGIGAIVPGKGAIIVQAMSNPFARVKGLKMIMADASSAEILKALKDPEYEPEEQQYAILCMNDPANPSTYTGNLAPAHKGALTANGISVQGNTLSAAGELKAVLDAAVKAKKDGLALQDILMKALEAGAAYGGDKRCPDTKASSAFLTVAKASDERQHPYINLVIYGNDEKVNAVEALRKKFNEWKNSSEK